MTIVDDDVHGLLEDATNRLREATRLETVQEIVRTTARRLVDADGATLVLREGNLCFYADEDAMSPLWKGQRFPVDTCISGWSMLNRQAAVIPDIRDDERIPQDAYRPTFVRSLVMVPVRVTAPVGAIGAYWAMPRRATEADAETLAVLAEATAQALAALPG